MRMPSVIATTLQGKFVTFLTKFIIYAKIIIKTEIVTRN